MKNNSLSATGLSLSQAQSISNLCFQRAKQIESTLSIVNNCTKELKLNGENYIETAGNKMPSNVIDLLTQKSRLHACQAFLMDNIKAKDSLLKDLQNKKFVTDLKQPAEPELDRFTEALLVDEQWGWSQLSIGEYNEYLEAEAFASHIGQFIHRNGKLDELRKELPDIKTLEWINIKDGEKTPLKITIHHTAQDLLYLHEELSAIHRQYEQRVNYFKAKVKNMVTEENARISKENSIKMAETNSANNIRIKEFENAYKSYQAEFLKLNQDFEEARQVEIKNIASLRIQIDPRFQAIIDVFLSK
jgi:hypothetical protein